MKIEISSDDVLSRFADALGNTRNLDRALRQGLQDGGNKTLTRVRRALYKQTGAKGYRSITSRTHGGLASGHGSLAYVIRGEGRGMPIGDFRVGVNAKGVLAFPWGQAHQFKRSFAHDGEYRARTTSARFPIRKLYGPSVAKELPQGESLRTFDAAARELVLDAITKRVARLLV